MRKHQADIAARGAYDYVGKLLAAYAALYALIATVFHGLALWFG
jgi:hypothetical protein